jgi:hypothetical protein
VPLLVPVRDGMPAFPVISRAKSQLTEWKWRGDSLVNASVVRWHS